MNFLLDFIVVAQNRFDRSLWRNDAIVDERFEIFDFGRSFRQRNLREFGEFFLLFVEKLKQIAESFEIRRWLDDRPESVLFVGKPRSTETNSNWAHRSSSNEKSNFAELIREERRFSSTNENISTFSRAVKKNFAIRENFFFCSNRNELSRSR